MEKVINVTMGLVEQHALDGAKISNQIRSSIEDRLSSLNTTVLGEYFSKTGVSKNLFSVAIEFEHLAMKRKFSTHTNSTNDLRSMLFCLLDFWEIDRIMFSKKVN